MKMPVKTISKLIGPVYLSIFFFFLSYRNVSADWFYGIKVYHERKKMVSAKCKRNESNELVKDIKNDYIWNLKLKFLVLSCLLNCFFDLSYSISRNLFIPKLYFLTFGNNPSSIPRNSYLPYPGHMTYKYTLHCL